LRGDAENYNLVRISYHKTRRSEMGKSEKTHRIGRISAGRASFYKKFTQKSPAGL